jgi:transcriptional regulator with XRE-family HTH domain
MITAGQMRAARMLLSLDQRGLAARAGVSLPTIQRMEASDGIVRSNLASLTRVVTALQAEGVELIGENGESHGGGRGVRIAEPGGRSGRSVRAHRSRKAT